MFRLGKSSFNSNLSWKYTTTDFQKERRYEFRHGKKTQDGLKSVQEITIVKIMVQNLAEYCLGKQKQFKI